MFELEEAATPVAQPTEGSENPNPLPVVRDIGRGEKGAGNYASRQYDLDQEESEQTALTLAPLDGGRGSPALGLDALEPKEAIAALRRMLAERDHALLRSALVNSDLQQEFEETKTSHHALKQQLAEVERAAEQAPSTKGDPPTVEDVARMKEQFRRAQKALEREYTRVKSELTRTKGEAFRATQQLESEARARRAEAAQASVKIATLQQQMEEVAKASFKDATSRNKKESRSRLFVGLGSVAALAVLSVGLWTWFSGPRTYGQPEDVATDRDIPAATIPAASGAGAPKQSFALSNAVASGNSLPSNNSVVPGGGSLSSPPSFQRSLSRLNNDLSGPNGRAPEQLLEEVRKNGARRGQRVCNFQWNGGQPSLMYGAGGSLDASLNQCSAAVEQYLAHR